MARPRAGAGGEGAPLTPLRAFPKIELHLHLEGAAPPDLVRRLGAAQGIDLAGLFAPDGGFAASDFASFLVAYERMSRVFDDPDTYADLTEAVLAAQAAEGVIHTEIFLSPPSLFGGDAGRWEAMRAAAEAGADRAEARGGPLCRFVPVLIRHHGPEAAASGAAAMLRAPRGRIRGLGLAGEERVFAPADFARPFRAAAEAGLRLTAHAGEWAGPESVRAALDALGPQRIGHGVRAAEEPALVARLAAEGVHLEICPGSNIALGLYPSLAAHPVEALRRAGVGLSVSTDDPPFFRTDMTREYAGLAAAFGWGRAEFEGLARAALAAAFVEPEARPALAARLDAALAACQ